MSGLRYDPALGAVVAARGAALVLMHMRGRPRDMYREAQYEDVVGDVRTGAAASVERALAPACPGSRSSLDPGLGFAKRAGHSLSRSGGARSVRGARPAAARRPSRKSFLTAPPGRSPPASATGPRLRRSRPRSWAALTSCACTASRYGAGRARRRRDPGRTHDLLAGHFRNHGTCMTWLNELSPAPARHHGGTCSTSLIVSIVVYEVLKLIRGTHAVQMAIGIATLVGLFYLSRGFQLETLNWLIRNVVGYVVFAAIVLMQGDIRRALVHLGRAPVFRMFRRFDRPVTDDDTLEEIVVAATTMAAKKTGALIVVERSIGLRNYIESGIPLDAHTDLRPAGQHFPADVAAARRRGDRAGRSRGRRGLFPAVDGQPAAEPRAGIAASRGNWRHRRKRRGRHHRLGRNRAASPSSMNGAIERNIEAEQLRRGCASLILRRRTMERRARSRVLGPRLMPYSPFRNVGLKFLSICIAALLWLVVAGDRVVERVMRVPIEFQNLPPGLEIVGDPPEAVDVRLRGSSGALGRLVPGDTVGRDRSAQRAAGPAPVPHHDDAGQSAVRVERRADCAVDAADRPSRTSAIRVVQVRAGRSTAVRRPATSIGAITTDPATVEVVGPESALQRLDEAHHRTGFGRQRRRDRSRGRDRRRRRSERAPADAADRRRHRADCVRRRDPHADGHPDPGPPNLDNGLRARAIRHRRRHGARHGRSAADADRPALVAHVDAAGVEARERELEVQVRAGPGLTAGQRDAGVEQ